jgi:phosphoribosylamine--glycine ligase
MQKHGIPTAAFHVFQDAHDAHDYVAKVAAPLVVKADGLAKGKGVIVCGSADEAHEAIRDIMERRVFGKAGDQVVIEECLRGQEASILAISDGRTIVLLEPAQDHKRIGDGDVGPNTGGMGAYSPVPAVTPALRDEIERRVFIPTIHGMRREGRRYQGILYAGIMLTGSGPQVLEFNVRWGDPEAQPILMRMKSDLVPALMAAAGGTLKESPQIEWDPRPAVCVVMASGGYPGDYEKGKPISGLDEAGKLRDVMVFHAGTAVSEGQVVTSGGRVLGVTALGKTIAEARERAYDAIARIHFDGAQFRRDNVFCHGFHGLHGLPATNCNAATLSIFAFCNPWPSVKSAATAVAVAFEGRSRRGRPGERRATARCTPAPGSAWSAPSPAGPARRPRRLGAEARA